MDILIKSFNRPYYLEKCLQSIFEFVQGYDKIIVLDDGTPQCYLDKIQSTFPQVSIQKSETYLKKSKAIKAGKPLPDSKIPIDFWVKAAAKASDYFVLLEDDIWFTNQIDLSSTAMVLKQQNSQMLKLFWLGNPRLIASKSIVFKNKIAISSPDLFTFNPFLFRWIFIKYKFKIRKLTTLIGWYSENRFLAYYTIYGVAGAVFSKNYFLSLWKNHNNQTNEPLQLENALRFINKNENATFGNTTAEVLKTGFVSSATNQNKEYETGSFDILQFNKIINEAWLEGRLGSSGSFEKDLDEKQIELLLKKANHPQVQVEDWEKWVQSFKKQYTDFGCIID